MLGRLARLAKAPLVGGLVLVAGLARRAARALAGGALPAIEDHENQALRNQVKFTNDLFESVPVALALRDREGRYLFVNRTWLQYFGYQREDVVGSTPVERIGEEAAARVLALDRAALERGPGGVELAEFDLRGRRYTQTRTVMADEQGQVIGVLVASLDTTEQHATHQRLRDQMALTEAIVQQIPNAIFTKDAEGRFTMVNRGWSEMSGVAAERALGRTVHDIYAPELAQRFAAEDAKLIAQGAGSAPSVAEHSGPRAGQWRIVKKAVLSRDDGTIMGLVATSTDISELKRVQAQLADRAKFEADLVDALPISVAMRDLECRFVQVNRTWERYFGIRREDAVGRRFCELPGWQDNPGLDEVARAAEALDRELMARGPDAPPILFEDTRLGKSYLLGRQLFTDSTGRVAGLLATGIDTTERHVAEQALAAERQRLALVVRATRAGIIDWDTATEAPWYSERFKEMLGYPPEHDTRDWAAIFGTLMHPEDRDRSREVFLAGLVSEGPPHGITVQAPLEIRLRCADGSWLWVESMGLTEHDAQGQAKRYLAAVTDISVRRAQEETLRNQAKFTNDLVDALPISVAMRDPERRFVRVNRTWERYFNVRREDAIGRRFGELPGWQETPERVASAKRGEQQDLDCIARGPDAPPFLIERVRDGRSYLTSRQVFTDAHGRLAGVLATGIDTTELREAEQALANEQRRLALVVRASMAGTLDWDGATRTVYYSPRFKEMLGFAPDADTSGWPDGFEGLVHPEDRERVHKVFRQHILGTGPEGKAERHPLIEYRLKRADGSYIWIETQGISVRNDEGYCTRFTASYIDITERRAHEQALKDSVRLREEVERMSRHDLKTPLNSVIAVSRLLREGGKLSREDEDLLSIVERAGYRILSMVNLSLDLYRMEQGAYQFQPQAVDLADVAHKVAADLEGQAASKNVALRLRQSGRSLARAEELLCYSMLANLVKNAIEAAPEGEVVSVTVEGASDTVSVHVHNPGAVPPAVRARFFDKYASSGKSAGLGLGTYSAQLMARVQEGDITLHTAETEGTTVSVRLVAARQLASRPEAQAPTAATGTRAERLPALPALRVLVVDDDEFNRLVLRRYLPSPPLTVAMAVNGRAALEAARGDWPDVVLLDLEMPVMDGYEAAAKLRALEREGRKPLKIIAISSNDDAAIVQKSLAAGCDHYLVKPAPREALFRLLAGEAVAQASPSAATAATDTPPPARVEIDPVLADKMPAFFASRRELLDAAAAAAGAGDRETLRRLAHRLAGSFALYGLRWAGEKSRSVERESSAGELGELAARLAAVRAHLDAVDVSFDANAPKPR